jgi:hypothetical protein
MHQKNSGAGTVPARAHATTIFLQRFIVSDATVGMPGPCGAACRRAVWFCSLHCVVPLELLRMTLLRYVKATVLVCIPPPHTRT